LFDLAIIGAGINGCSVAYEFSLLDKKVVIFDMDKIAGGGSGAAGAFLAPKFSKTGELKEMLHEAFDYSMEFYENNFSNFFTKTQLLHLAKDEESSKLLKLNQNNLSFNFKKVDKVFFNSLTPYAKKYEHICMNAGVVNAQKMCQALCQNAKYIKHEVKNISHEDGVWNIDDLYRSKNILLATGAYKSLLDEEYLKLSGVWGHRIDVKTTTKNPYSIHQDVSISPSVDGVLAIGATHDVHYHPQFSKEIYDVQKGRDELLQKASKSINLENIEILKDYTGLRSGSYDYMPHVGGVVKSHETLQCCEHLAKTKKVDYEKFIYYPNLYMINGNGGYGFVLAPYLAKILTKHILLGEKVKRSMNPARFFARWVRRL